VADRSAPSGLATASSPSVSRRKLFAGVGTAGALAATAVALPLVQVPETSTAKEPAEGSSSQGGGYRLSAHVQRYYQTAKV
jgi:hypothetical protein